MDALLWASSNTQAAVAQGEGMGGEGGNLKMVGQRPVREDVHEEQALRLQPTRNVPQ